MANEIEKLAEEVADKVLGYDPSKSSKDYFRIFIGSQKWRLAKIAAKEALEMASRLNDWVSVDNPPKENGEYMVWVECEDFKEFRTAYFFNGRWATVYELIITHWKPITPPNKEKC